MKTPKMIHPKPPRGWRVTVKRNEDPDIEAYFAFVWTLGKCVDVCMHDDEGTEYITRPEAKRAGIQRAHELSTPNQT